MPFVEKIESLRKATQDNAVYNAECEHITGYHRVDHGYKRTRQTNSTGKRRFDRESIFFDETNKLWVIKTTHPAKNINKNQLPGTAKISMASSVSVSPIKRKGMQARIIRLETRNIALAGA